ncbi:MAG: class I SAM-dependent methyltransferase [Candidatus Shapirobacteria bacterium]
MICPLCHSSKYKKIFTTTNFHGRHEYGKQKISFNQCQNCDCLFPAVKTDNAFYKKYYPKKYNTNSPLLEKLWINFSLFVKKTYLPQKGSLLDVGCGKGEFIKSLPSTIKATGIDINPLKIDNINLIQGDFLKYKFNKKFDIITFWHSLEHFSNPKNVTLKALNLLKPNGKIIISLPNTNSLAFKIGQQRWFHLDAPRHLFLPNDKNIHLLFPKNTNILISHNPFEFPLDLFWSLKNKAYLRFFYPILKILDRETMTITVTKSKTSQL